MTLARYSYKCIGAQCDIYKFTIKDLVSIILALIALYFDLT